MANSDQITTYYIRRVRVGPGDKYNPKFDSAITDKRESLHNQVDEWLDLAEASPEDFGCLEIGMYAHTPKPLIEKRWDPPVEKEWVRPPIRHLEPVQPWQWMVAYPHKFSLGFQVDIGAFSFIQAEYGVEIGDYAKIGAHCAIYSVSTIQETRGPVVIGEGCMIGTHTTIMPGVSIGENTKIGAHSYIDKDIGPNVIVHPEVSYNVKPRRKTESSSKP